MPDLQVVVAVFSYFRTGQVNIASDPNRMLKLNHLLLSHHHFDSSKTSHLKASQSSLARSISETLDLNKTSWSACEVHRLFHTKTFQLPQIPFSTIHSNQLSIDTPQSNMAVRASFENSNELSTVQSTSYLAHRHRAYQITESAYFPP